MNEIDLSQLPAPDVVQPLNFESELARLQALVLESMPELEEVLALESEPATKMLQLIAYENVNMQSRINDSAKACMLAYALEADLDHMVANLGAERLPGEPDEDLRRRGQLAPEGTTAAGSYGSYRFYALSAHADVRDASIDSPAPGVVRATVLSRVGNGAASLELLKTVGDALNAQDVRPISDDVWVQSAQIVPFEVRAVLHVYPGPAAQPLLDAARQALADYIEKTRKLGYDVTRSGLFAALHQPGVQRVDLLSPAVDLVMSPAQAGDCTSQVIELGSVDV